MRSRSTIAALALACMGATSPASATTIYDWVVDQVTDHSDQANRPDWYLKHEPAHPAFTPPPTDSAGCIVGTVGSPVSFQLHVQTSDSSEVYGSGAYDGDTSYSLPSGLSLSSSGQVTGNPSTSGAGSISFWAKGTNNYNYSQQQCYQIGYPESLYQRTADELAYPNDVPAVAPHSLQIGTIPDGYTDFYATKYVSAPAVVGQIGTLRWSIQPPPPTGFAFAEGVLYGANTQSSPRSFDYQYSITVGDEAGQTATTNLGTLHVDYSYGTAAPPSPTGHVSVKQGWHLVGVSGQPLAPTQMFVLDNMPATGMTWTFYGSHPSGLRIDQSTGIIFGTPDVQTGPLATGSFSGDVAVRTLWTDAAGNPRQATNTINVWIQPLVVQSTPKG